MEPSFKSLLTSGAPMGSGLSPSEKPEHGRTILVVDDDPNFLGQTEELLSAAGYRVLQASDGIRAVQLLEQLRGCIDLAIVDLALPGLNGFELIGALSRRPNSVKIIATSGVFGDMQLESATAVGAHAAIRKPPKTRGLPRQQWLRTVQQLIGTP
jgi:CheY-like chemotaxis protein